MLEMIFIRDMLLKKVFKITFWRLEMADFPNEIIDYRSLCIK